MTNKQIISKIKKAKNIAIFAHRAPDPDACGSMFGLKEFCLAVGQNNVDVFVKKTKEKYLDFIFPLNETKQNFVASEYDLVVFVDMHEIKRAEYEFQEELKKANNVLIIDHHMISQEENFSYKNYRIKDTASCSQMMVDLYDTAEIKPSAKAAEYIYAGIMGDTDRFLHPNLSIEVFEKAKYLFECGANVQHVYDYLYRFKTQGQIKVNKFFLNKLQYIKEGKVAYFLVSEKDKNKLNADREDIKTFASEMIKIKGVKLSFLCYEFTGGHYKVSLRSVGDLDTRILANRMNGGGHKNSSGFDVYNTNKKKLKKMIPLWSKELLND